MTIQDTQIALKFDPNMPTPEKCNIQLTALAQERDKKMAYFQKQIDAAEAKCEDWRVSEINVCIAQVDGAYTAALSRWNEKLKKAIANEALNPIKFHPNDFDARHKDASKKEWIRNGGTAEDFETAWPQLKNNLLINLTSIGMRRDIAPSQPTISKL
jgi:hypothetical protein